MVSKVNCSWNHLPLILRNHSLHVHQLARLHHSKKFKFILTGVLQVGLVEEIQSDIRNKGGNEEVPIVLQRRKKEISVEHGDISINIK